MRAIWKGSISFSLVNIPIALYSAVRREELSFRLLRDADLSPIDNKRVAEADGQEVPWEHIVLRPANVCSNPGVVAGRGGRLRSGERVPSIPVWSGVGHNAPGCRFEKDRGVH